MITIKTLLESPEDFEDKDRIKIGLITRCYNEKYVYDLFGVISLCYFILRFQ